VALPDAGVEPISRPLSVSAQGSVIGDLDLSLAGRWTLALSVLVSDFERVTFRTELIVQEEKAPSSNTQRKKRRWGPAYVCLVMTGLIGGWQEGKPPGTTHETTKVLSRKTLMLVTGLLPAKPSPG
jgi:hypothetical protein